MRVSATSLLPATLEIVERHAIPMVLFTADEDSGYRDGYVYSTADLHRMRDTYSHPPRARKRRYATYSGSSGYAGGGGCGGGFFGGDGGAAAPTAAAEAGAAAEAAAAAARQRGQTPLRCKAPLPGASAAQ